MGRIFLEAQVYKLMLDKPIKFIIYTSPDGKEPETSEIVFNPDAEIKIITFGEGGGCGFSPLIIYQTMIKATGGEIQKFEEVHLNRNKTPIRDFVIENKDVLFQLVTTV